MYLSTIAIHFRKGFLRNFLKIPLKLFTRVYQHFKPEVQATLNTSSMSSDMFFHINKTNITQSPYLLSNQ